MTQDRQQGAEIGYQGHQQKSNTRRGTSWKEFLNAISTEKVTSTQATSHKPSSILLRTPPDFCIEALCELGYYFRLEYKPMINRLKQLTGAYVLRARLPRCTDWVHTASGAGEEGNSRRRGWGNGDNGRNWTSEFRAWLSRCTNRIHASFFHCHGHDRNIHDS
jgi:hypothetical protein